MDKLKEIFKKIRKLFLSYQYESSVIVLSILVLIVGTFAIGFLYTFLIIIIFDCATILTPILIKMYKRDKLGKKAIIDEKTIAMRIAIINIIMTMIILKQ